MTILYHHTRALLALFALSLLIGMTGQSSTTETYAADKPNFVFVISEDNSKHFLKLFDEHGAETPCIEKMAAHGLCFDNAYSNAPVCSCARSTIETSCYGPRIGTHFHRKEVQVPMPEGQSLFPAYLRKAGYYTTNQGKTDYNMIPGDDAWDLCTKNADWHSRKPGQPFFHKQSSYPVTHESRLHFPESDVKNVPTETDPETVFIPPYHPKTETFKYTYARYHDRIMEMDGQVAQLVQKLEDEGLLEDTFIFYFGDHGGVLPRGKGYAYDSGLHVPMVVRIPENFKHLVNAPIGSRVDGFVQFIDLGPTLLNLAGVEMPEGMDGRPFLGSNVTLDELNSRDEAFGYADRFDEKYDLVRTLRKGNFEYMRSYQPFNFDGLQNDYRYKMAAYREWRDLYDAGKLDAAQSQFFEAREPEMLFDLEADPYEIRNLADDPQYADVLTDMRKRMTERVKGMPDLSFFPESHLAKEALATNPTGFGQANKDAIAKLVDVADLQLLPFEQAEPKLREAIDSDDPWQRYWGLISCSSHGQVAEYLVEKAKLLAQNDPEPLVRTRAAEFLALTGVQNPSEVLVDALLDSDSQVEANLILNTAVLLQDGKPGYDLDLSQVEQDPRIKKWGRYVNDRLQYLKQK